MTSHAEAIQEQFRDMESAELVERAQGGTLTSESQALAELELQHRGISLDRLPADIVDALESTVQPTKTRPWIRYWARFVDLYIVVFYTLLVIVLVPVLRESNNPLMPLAIAFSWVFLEPLVLRYTGTTLGKWLLGVRVVLASGQPMTYRQAFVRTFRVWWRGLAAGMPIVMFFTLVVAYRRLKDRGVTSWDEDGGFVVTHQPVRILRALVAVGIVAGAYLLMNWPV